MFGLPSQLPEDDPDAINLRNRAKYLRRFKDALYSRWTGEYITSLKEADRAARLRAGKSFLERAIQHLCPMEMSCCRFQEHRVTVLNPTAREFQPRRDAAIAAAQCIKVYFMRIARHLFILLLLCLLSRAPCTN